MSPTLHRSSRCAGWRAVLLCGGSRQVFEAVTWPPKETTFDFYFLQPQTDYNFRMGSILSLCVYVCVWVSVSAYKCWIFMWYKHWLELDFIMPLFFSIIGHLNAQTSQDSAFSSCKGPENVFSQSISDSEWWDSSRQSKSSIDYFILNSSEFLLFLFFSPWAPLWFELAGLILVANLHSGCSYRLFQ